ncbi:MAG: hypothetical protein IJT09_02790 [Abditibacteriota bacterium]|nr:hypothetical protein [Abditibacteriota bacterium]
MVDKMFAFWVGILESIFKNVLNCGCSCVSLLILFVLAVCLLPDCGSEEREPEPPEPVMTGQVCVPGQSGSPFSVEEWTFTVSPPKKSVYANGYVRNLTSEDRKVKVTVKAFSPTGKLIDAKESEEVVVRAGKRTWTFACPEVPDDSDDVIKTAVVSQVRY